jgi:hypothetical protein
METKQIDFSAEMEIFRKVPEYGKTMQSRFLVGPLVQKGDTFTLSSKVMQKGHKYSPDVIINKGDVRVEYFVCDNDAPLAPSKENVAAFIAHLHTLGPIVKCITYADFAYENEMLVKCGFTKTAEFDWGKKKGLLYILDAPKPKAPKAPKAQKKGGKAKSKKK